MTSLSPPPPPPGPNQLPSSGCTSPNEKGLSIVNIEVAKICKELSKLTRDKKVIHKRMIKAQDAQKNIANEIKSDR